MGIGVVRVGIGVVRVDRGGDSVGSRDGEGVGVREIERVGGRERGKVIPLQCSEMIWTSIFGTQVQELCHLPQEEERCSILHMSSNVDWKVWGN